MKVTCSYASPVFAVNVFTSNRCISNVALDSSFLVLFSRQVVLMFDI